MPADTAGDEGVGSPPIEVSALVVNYNTGDLVQALVDTLIEQEIQRDDGSAAALEILVLDNGSPADQRPFLEPLAARGVRVVYQAENLGYAGGANAAVQLARGRYVLVLNADVLVAPGAVQALLAHLRSRPGVGLAAPFGFLDPARFWMLPPLAPPTLAGLLAETAGHRLRFVARRLSRRRSRAAAAYWSAPAPVARAGASGYAFMMPVELARALGPFDEGYPLYFEDGDLCRRLRRAGHAVEVVPGAIMAHLYDRSAGQEAALSAAKNRVSARRYYRKFYGAIGGLAAEAAARLSDSRHGHWRPASEATALGALSASPAPTLPRPVKRWLALLSFDPCFTFAAGHFGEGDRLEIPADTWRSLPPATMYLRLLDAETGDVLATYSFDKIGPGLLDRAPAAWAASRAPAAEATAVRTDRQRGDGGPRPWVIRDYSPGDEERIVPFFNQVFGAGSPDFAPRSIDFWRWQFERNPLGHRACVAEDADGRLIGSYAGIRVPFLHAGERRVAAQVVDTCVAAEYRHGGLFIELAHAYFDRFGHPQRDFICFGYPNPPAFRAGTRHLEYLPVHCPVYTLTLSPSPRWVRRTAAGGGDLAVAPLDRLGPEIDALWDRVRADHQFTTWRDAAYLRWRYLEHPTVRYRVLAARAAGGDLRGLAVVRERCLGQPNVGIVEWVIPRREPAVVAALAAAAGHWALERGLRRLETWVAPACPERDSLHRLGFRDQASAFNLAVRNFDPALGVDWMRAHWFYTMGDADFY